MSIRLPNPVQYSEWKKWAEDLFAALVLPETGVDRRIYLQARSRAAATFNSATWTSFHNSGASFVDKLQQGISITNSTLTFAKGGLYKICLHFSEELMTGGQMGLRVTRAGSTLLASMNQLDGLIRVSAKDQLILEYAIEAANNWSWASLTLDGQAMDMCVLNVLEVGTLN